MNVLIKLLFFVISKVRHYRVVLSHWFWVRHYHGRLILSGYKISDLPLSFIIGLSGSIRIEENVSFAGTSKLLVEDGGRIEIGSNTFFNRGCSLNSMEKIQIGRHCLFGEDVKIYDHNHRFNKEDVLIRDQGYSRASVCIGDNTWIGSNVIILKGVTIGRHVVIGANCIVSESVSDNNIVTSSGGNLITRKINFT